MTVNLTVLVIAFLWDRGKYRQATAAGMTVFFLDLTT